MSVGQTRDSHSETMAKKVVRAEIGLLRDDWFLPVQKAALDRALIAVGQGKHYRIAASEALDETFKEFGLEGLSALIGSSDPKALEAAEHEG
jgi:hypothetical protein